MVLSRQPMSFRRSLGLLFLAMSTTWSAAPDRARTLAVLELASPGIPKADAATVSARLGLALAATGRFRLVDRAPAQGDGSRSPTGICREMDCALRVGKDLKVDRVVFGELAIDGPAWVVSTRMVDVATSSLLLRTTVRTENGFRDLVDRGAGVLATRYDSTESRLDAIVARHNPEEIRGIRDTALEARLDSDRRLLKTMALVATVTGTASLVVGIELYLINLFASMAPGREPDMSASYACFGAGIALGLGAFLSATASQDLERKLEAQKRKSLLDLTWAPVWVPSRGTVGLATRVDF